MADPRTYRPAQGEIPRDPGVYKFRDRHGRVIYVGKAKNLRNRLSNYFQPLKSLHPRTQQMVTTAASVEWTVVGTEVEALSLEYSWIKEFAPRFNIKYRDDKSYPYLSVTMSEEFPRVQVTRGKKRRGDRYFGPYSHAWAIRETVDLLLRVFPVRTCSKGVFERARKSERPCLLGYIDRCSAPCVGRVTPQEHRQIAEDFCDFMAGDSSKYLKLLRREMEGASRALDFERAAKLRDDIGALEKVVERNVLVLPDETDADVFALVQDELEAAVQVFHVRGGRVRGQQGWIVEKVEDVQTPELVERLLQQIYGEDGDVPKEILVPVMPTNAEQLCEWLRGRRGSKVDIRVAQRGEKKNLAQTVEQNAAQALTLHKSRRSSDLTTRSQALKELQEALGLEEAPLRIECYDISHTQGTNQVASMVVFEDGLARKSEYRHFAIRGANGDGAADDTEAMHEVITRRFKRYLETGVASSAELDEASEAPSSRFAYPPNLVVVDGGPPQVAAAQRALEELEIHDVALVGLAKRLEEVWLPGDPFPVILPRSSEGLYLLQRVRDEAHRFAITYHRSKRSKAMRASVLDDIAGLGPARQKTLLKHFGSVKKMKEADVEDLCAVKGVGPRLASEIFSALHPLGQE